MLVLQADSLHLQLKVGPAAVPVHLPLLLPSAFSRIWPVVGTQGRLAWG